MKKTFTYRTEWSDQSEHSPQTVGQLPNYLTLPGGKRISLEPMDYWPRPSRSGYIQIHENVRIRLSFWGDDGTRRIGRAGGKSEILAPKGSIFYFDQLCPYCGVYVDSMREDQLDANGKAPRKYHPDCARIVREMSD